MIFDEGSSDSDLKLRSFNKTDLSLPTRVHLQWVTVFVRWPTSLRYLTFCVVFTKTFRARLGRCPASARKAGWCWGTCPSWVHCLSTLMLWHLTLVGLLKLDMLKVPIEWVIWLASLKFDLICHWSSTALNYQSNIENFFDDRLGYLVRWLATLWRWPTS